MSAVQVLSHGTAFDPGLKTPERILSKARARQCSWQREPPLESIVDVARLAVQFDTISDPKPRNPRHLTQLKA